MVLSREELERRKEDIERQRAALREPIDMTGHEPGTKEYQKVYEMHSNYKRNRSEQLQAQLSRVDRDLRAYRTAEARGSDVYTEVRRAKRGEFRREAAALEGTERQEFLAQRRAIRAQARQSRLRRAGESPSSSDNLLLREYEYQRAKRETPVTTARARRRVAAQQSTMTPIRQGTVVIKDDPQRASYVKSRLAEAKDLEDRGYKNAEDFFVYSSSNMSLDIGGEEYVANVEPPGQFKRNISLASGGTGYVAPMSYQTEEPKPPVRTTSIRPGSKGAPTPTQTIFRAGKRGFIGGLTWAPGTFDERGEGRVAQGVSDVAAVGGFILSAAGPAIISRGYSRGAALLRTPIAQQTASVVNKIPLARAAIGLKVGEYVGEATSYAGRVIDEQRMNPERLGITTQEYRTITETAFRESRPKGFFRETAFFISPGLADAPEYVTGREPPVKTAYEESVKRQLESRRDLAPSQKEAIVAQTRRGFSTRSITQASGSVIIGATAERYGAKGITSALSSLSPTITTGIKGGLKQYSRTASITGLRIASAGALEGAGMYVQEQRLTGKEKTKEGLLLSGTAGYLTAGVLGGAIAGAGGVGQKTASRALNIGVNVVDIAEAPGDFLAGVLESSARRRGVRSVTPTFVVDPRRKTLSLVPSRDGGRPREPRRTKSRPLTPSPARARAIGPPTITPVLSPTKSPVTRSFVPSIVPSPIPSLSPAPTVGGRAPIVTPSPVPSFTPSFTPTPTPTPTPATTTTPIPVTTPDKPGLPFFWWDAGKKTGKKGRAKRRKKGRRTGYSHSFFAVEMGIRAPKGKKPRTPRGGFTGLEIRPLV